MKSKRGILKYAVRKFNKRTREKLGTQDGTGGTGYPLTSANMPLPVPSTNPFGKVATPAPVVSKVPVAPKPALSPMLGSGSPRPVAPGVTPSPFPAPVIKPPVVRTPVSPFNRFQLGANKALEPRKYTVRGMTVTEADLTEAEKILYSEISNRKDSKKNLELKHIIDTALNRMKEKQGATLTQILQAPNQYQGYAPKGTTRRGKVTESEYQRVARGEYDKEKMAIVRAALDDLRNGKFETGSSGATNYVHATDGTIWVGKTIAEAKQLARKHEKKMRIAPSQFGTTTGMPNY